MALGTQVQEVLLLASTDGVPVTDTGGRALPILHTGQRLHVIPYVWNTGTLAFEPQEKGGAGGGDASAANQASEIARLEAIRDRLPTVLSGDRLKVELPAGGGGLTDAELRATAVPVSGPLTDAQLRALAVAVSGPLTDAQLRAIAVAVSGPLTDAQLRAVAVPVSAAALPLPAGAATFAQQDLEIDALDALLLELQAKTEPADTQKAALIALDHVASAPTSATVGVASATAVAANASRTGLIVRNTSAAGQRISLGLDGAPAVLDSGLTLETGDVYVMEAYDFTTGAVAAIASAAAGRLSIQEYT